MEQTKAILTGMTIGLLLALTGCGPGTSSPAAPESPARVPSDVEAAAKDALSAETGVAVEEIDVVGARQMDWPDACLGLAEEGEMCAQVVTPGWEITLRAEGEEYVLHTDEEAEAIRMEEPQ